MGKGKSKGEGKSKGPGPRQEAHQICHVRFNKIINDLACKKSFFMSFARYPSKLNTCDGVRHLLLELKRVMDSKEYENMRKTSLEKSAEDAELKRKRDEARKLLHHGRNNYYNNIETSLADAYAKGTLQENVTVADKAFGYRKQAGVAVLLNM